MWTLPNLNNQHLISKLKTLLLLGHCRLTLSKLLNIFEEFYNLYYKYFHFFSANETESNLSTMHLLLQKMTPHVCVKRKQVFQTKIVSYKD